MNPNESNVAAELRAIKRVLLVIAGLLVMIAGILDVRILIIGTMIGISSVAIGFVLKAIYQAIRRSDALHEERERTAKEIPSNES